jgi:hypothetical protein
MAGRPDRDPPGSRGDSWRTRARRALGRELFASVQPEHEAAVARALRTRSSIAALTWAARVEGVDAQYLLVIDRDATGAEVAGVVQRLVGAGATVGRMLVEDILSQEAFRALLAATREFAQGDDPA